MILLVEDDQKLAAVVTEFLEGRGFQVAHESNGFQAAARIVAERPDLVILDLLLPGLSGIEVCRRTRSEYPGPILMLTALGDEGDEVAGLEVGADDYLAKPVRPRVLLARVQALLRRTTTHPLASASDRGAELELIDLGKLRIDRDARVAYLSEQLLGLTTSEFELLDYLARRAGQVVSREQICRDLRGIEWDGLDRSIDIRVTRLRRKLGDCGKSPKVIKSIRGEGYLMTVRR
ncbi:MAG TPA: response regulator transcription factor [Polyangiaceae bacterium]|nr:response regulator transcription factor [Polyangiaceae bacterium]